MAKVKGTNDPHSGGLVVSKQRNGKNTTRTLVKPTKVLLSKVNKQKIRDAGQTIRARPLGVSIDNFYVTDFVCENSAIMIKTAKARYTGQVGSVVTPWSS